MSEVFGIIVKYAVFLSNRTFRGMSFHRNKFFHHFLQLNQKLSDFVSFFQQCFQKFFFPLKRTFEGELLAYEWKIRREILGHSAENFCTSHKFFPPGLSKMILRVQKNFWGTSPEERCFCRTSGHWAKKVKLLGRSNFGIVKKLSSTCRQQEFQHFLWKTLLFLIGFRTYSWISLHPHPIFSARFPQLLFT